MIEPLEVKVNKEDPKPTAKELQQQEKHGRLIQYFAGWVGCYDPNAQYDNKVGWGSG